MTRPTEARIFPAHLAHNAARVRELAPDARILACVKADGYGHGILTAARALRESVQGYAVACIDEALQLRAAGFDEKIVLLEGPQTADEVVEAAARGLTLCIHGDHQLRWLEQAGPETRVECWMKIDTGMHRLGFAPQAIAAACERLRRWPGLRSDPVLCTHFASADKPTGNALREQLDIFDRSAGPLGLPQSCANSAAILRSPESHRDWVRPGYMLYGGCPLSEGDATGLGLRPAMQFSSQVIALRDIAAGEGVGYGARWRARRASRIATVAVGYADGYPRHAPDGTPVLVHGRRMPLAGRVSMDMITVDVSDHPDVVVGSPVELWGAEVPVDEVARRADTIGYALLAAMPGRVPRRPQY